MVTDFSSLATLDHVTDGFRESDVPEDSAASTPATNAGVIPPTKAMAHPISKAGTTREATQRVAKSDDDKEGKPKVKGWRIEGKLRQVVEKGRSSVPGRTKALTGRTRWSLTLVLRSDCASW